MDDHAVVAGLGGGPVRARSGFAGRSGFAAGLLAVLWVSAFGVPAVGQVPPLPPPTNVEDAVARILVIGRLQAEDIGRVPFATFPVGHGSGAFISPDIMLTAAHVVEGATVVAVVPPGAERPVPATVAFSDAALDLAFLVVDHRSPVFLELPSEPSPPPSLRTPVFAYGFPREAAEPNPSVTEGIVSRWITEGLLQVSAALNPGVSGGPVVDAANVLVGVAIARHREGEAMGYIRPIADAIGLYRSRVLEGTDIDRARERMYSPTWENTIRLAELAAGWNIGLAEGRAPLWLLPVLECTGQVVDPVRRGELDEVVELATQGDSPEAKLVVSAVLWNIVACRLSSSGVMDEADYALADVFGTLALRMGESWPATCETLVTAVGLLDRVAAAAPALLQGSPFPAQLAPLRVIAGDSAQWCTAPRPLSGQVVPGAPRFLSTVAPAPPGRAR
jgi:hypothetical protein